VRGFFRRKQEAKRNLDAGFVTNFPNITTALWWQELVSKSIHREWIVSVAQQRQTSA
jgi:hypothetical protein